MSAAPLSRGIIAAFVSIALGLCMLLTGCAHYRLGTEGSLTFHRLYIEPVENDAGIAQATALVSTQIREAFIRDGRVTLVANPGDAEAVLQINLARYDRNAASARPDDTGLARKFEITLTAHCTLRDTRSGKLLFEKRPVASARQVFTTPSPSARTSDQIQAEYNTLPLLASSLADRVAHTVLDVW